MKRADPNIWLYGALFSYMLGSNVIGGLCVCLAAPGAGTDAAGAEARTQGAEP